MAVSPDGRQVAVGSDEDDGVTIGLFDVESRRPLDSLRGHVGHVHRLAFSPDSGRLASASWDRQVGIWDVGRRRLVKMLHGHIDEVYGVAFSPDGRTLASSGVDGVRLWSTTTLREITWLKTYANVESVAFSADGHWLAAAANDGTIRLWRAPSWEEIDSKETSRSSRGGG